MTTNILQTIRKWSVQASNLRPPVSMVSPRAGLTPTTPDPATETYGQIARSAGESAAPKSNGTAIARPDPYAPRANGGPSNAFTAWKVFA